MLLLLLPTACYFSFTASASSSSSPLYYEAEEGGAARGGGGSTSTSATFTSTLLCVALLVLLAAPPASAKRGSGLKEITDGNWEDILAGEWMIKFFAPWCPACQQLQSPWSEFADWGEDMGVNIAKVDVTEQPGLSGRFIITSLPTIYHCKDGVFRKYQGARTKEDFLSFVDEQKWRAIEPVSSWFGPSSFLMNSMSALFKLSMFIRARLIQQEEEEQEADGEEDDEDEEEEMEEYGGSQDEDWTTRRRGSPEGRTQEEAVRKRRVAQEQDADEEEDT
ncbi:hypothetical protein CRUP_031083 [Coryphaenoides rupestris]|nr:hypothetical protein CRUP_031083 [Coryphaenoides rupestris]